MVANRSTFKEDLYLVYEGLNQTLAGPFLRCTFNPLVMWIWPGCGLCWLARIDELDRRCRRVGATAQFPSAWERRYTRHNDPQHGCSER